MKHPHFKDIDMKVAAPSSHEYGGRGDAKFRNLVVNGLEKAYEKYCK